VNAGGIVFLLDVDNTLLDNDRFAADLGEHLQLHFGAAARARYFSIFAELRERLGIADYLASLQGFRAGLDDDPRLLQMSNFLLEYPFAELVYEPAFAAIAHLRTLGLPVILSDGDVVFQPRKIERSGIWDAVEGRVMIYVHKERELDHVQRRYPGAHYVMVDDKPNLLAAMKTALGPKLTTVFVRQGHYALAPGADAVLPPPDRAIGGIGELKNFQLRDFQEHQ
jgi:FMN phosphatase YigB (HAD superfamily)